MDGAPFSLLQSLTYVWKMKGTILDQTPLSVRGYVGLPLYFSLGSFSACLELPLVKLSCHHV